MLDSCTLLTKKAMSMRMAEKVEIATQQNKEERVGKELFQGALNTIPHFKRGDSELLSPMP